MRLRQLISQEGLQADDRRSFDFIDDAHVPDGHQGTCTNRHNSKSYFEQQTRDPSRI